MSFRFPPEPTTSTREGSEEGNANGSPAAAEKAAAEAVNSKDSTSSNPEMV